ncbi:MAG: DMT family transporter [Desulfobacula sp.]|nr:DMT family transporter [Desulfobacula sp.]MBT3486592.1 DMT family transporter [Desulfobacula sp.]MBT3805749.1 DMT family transporter [Desulfobacula sp.]MBT4023932.1 DMT family transporter [Desulfobacula sp.]MBT4200338.1 DMT family transporter [Desulfobacula sp.]
MGIKLWCLIILLSIIWGASFFFVEIAVEKMTPLTIVLYRVGFAAFLLLAFVRLTGRKMPKTIGIWGAFLALGALNNAIPFTLITWGQSHIDSSLASILNATAPVFSVILAHFLTKDEPLTKNRLAGVLFGWGGVALLIGIDALNGAGMKMAGQLAVLGAALFYAFAAIFARRFKDIDPVVVSAGMLTGSTIIMIPMAFIMEQPLALDPTPVTWAALFGLAAISTSLAYIIYFYVLSKAGATNILLVTFLIPVSAIFLGMAVLGENPGWNAFAGMGLIFIGLVLIDGRLLKRGS